MQTPTHLLIAAAAFCRPKQIQINAAALAGGLAPDAFLIGLWAWSKLNGVPERTLWGELYWSPPVQLGQAISNSLPLFAFVLIISLLVRRRAVAVLAGAGLLHLAADFPVHGSDAHVHFWPFSNWRFHSPVSYWEPDRYGVVVGGLEGLLAIGLIILLWRRFAARWIRAVLITALAAYVIVPAYFILTLS